MPDYNIDISALTSDQQVQSADLLQQLVAIDAALAEVQLAHDNIENDTNAKFNALQAKRDEVSKQLVAIREIKPLPNA